MRRNAVGTVLKWLAPRCCTALLINAGCRCEISTCTRRFAASGKKAAQGSKWGRMPNGGSTDIRPQIGHKETKRTIRGITIGC